MPDKTVPDVGALRLTQTQKFYAQTALDRLADRYEKDGQPEHASACRLLSGNVAAQAPATSAWTPEMTAFWQQRLGECGGDPVLVRAVMREWWADVCCRSADPAVELADALIQVVGQAGVGMAAIVLSQTREKLLAIGRDRKFDDPRFTCNGCGAELERPHGGAEKAMLEVFRFVQVGLEALQRGQNPWTDDEHLLAAAREAQVRAQTG